MASLYGKGSSGMSKGSYCVSMRFRPRHGFRAVRLSRPCRGIRVSLARCRAGRRAKCALLTIGWTMAKTPRAGEKTTVNYGWTKPTVGASVDAWGGLINANLDGIDSTVHAALTTSKHDPAWRLSATDKRHADLEPTLNRPLVLDIPTNNEIVGVAVWSRRSCRQPSGGDQAICRCGLNDNRIINGNFAVATSGLPSPVRRWLRRLMAMIAGRRARLAARTHSLPRFPTQPSPLPQAR